MQVNNATIKALAKSINAKSKFVDGFVWSKDQWVILEEGVLLVKKVLAHKTHVDLFVHGHCVGTVSDVRDLLGLEIRLADLFRQLARHVTYQHGQNISEECKASNWDFHKYGFKVSKEPIEGAPMEMWTVCFNNELVVQLPFSNQKVEDAEFMMDKAIRATVLDNCFGVGFIFEIIPGEIIIKNMNW